MLSRGAMSLQESIERFILSPGWGKVRRSRIGGGERSEPIRRMLIIPYDIESQSRNADFISIAREGNPPPSAPQALSPPERSEHNLPPSGGHNPRGEAPSTFPSEPSEPSEPEPQSGPKGPINLKNLFPQPFYTTCRRKAAITFARAAGVNLPL